MHSISANNKTATNCTMKESTQNTLKEVKHAYKQMNVSPKHCVACLSTHTTEDYVETLIKPYAFMLRVHCEAYSVIQHYAEGFNSTPFFFFFSLYNVGGLSIVGWKIFFSCLCLMHTIAKNEVGKKTRTILLVLGCLKYDSSVYLTDFCISVRSEYSARSAAVRAFVP